MAAGIPPLTADATDAAGQAVDAAANRHFEAVVGGGDDDFGAGSQAGGEAALFVEAAPVGVVVIQVHRNALEPRGEAAQGELQAALEQEHQLSAEGDVATMNQNLHGGLSLFLVSTRFV